MNARDIAIAQELNHETSQQGLLSFGNGIKNILGVRYTQDNIRLKIKNNRETDAIIYLMPSLVLGVNSWDEDNGKVNPLLGLDDGIPFFKSGLKDTADKTVDITALTPGQHLEVLAAQIANEPTQFVGISMKSFDNTGAPENTNYGNSLTKYKLSHLEEIKRGTPLNFDAYQNSRDVSTEILKIDFIKNNFQAIMTQKDVLSLRVNAGTTLNLTLHLGARLSQDEFFYRQTKAGAKVLRQAFPSETVEKSC